jgi:hypothetical protein
MKISLFEIKNLIKEALTPDNKRALRFGDFWKDRVPVNKSDLGIEFDKAIQLFVDEDNERLIPFEDPDTGELRMMKRKNSRARTTVQKVLDAHIQYNGKVPPGSRYSRYKPDDGVAFKSAPGKSYKATHADSFVGSQVSGRRETDNSNIKSAGMSGPLKQSDKNEILNDITDVIAIIHDDIANLPGPQKNSSIISMLRLDRTSFPWWDKVAPVQLDALVKQAIKDYVE